MPKKEEAYACKKCGYVLPKKDAIICMHASQLGALDSYR